MFQRFFFIYLFIWEAIESIRLVQSRNHFTQATAKKKHLRLTLAHESLIGCLPFVLDFGAQLIEERKTKKNQLHFCMFATLFGFVQFGKLCFIRTTVSVDLCRIFSIRM